LLKELALLTTSGATYSISDLQPGTLYGLRLVTANAAGSSNGSVLLTTTLSSTQAFITLEFDANFTEVFGAQFSAQGLPRIQLNVRNIDVAQRTLTLFLLFTTQCGLSA
jgi:hypothetical protein